MAAKTDKSLFYHVPRTGGVWVKHALRRSGLHYQRALYNNVGNDLKMHKEHAPPNNVLESEKVGRYSFCFVRHPIDWYKSFWCFRLKRGHAQLRNPLDWYCWDNIFEKFVDNALNYYQDGYVTRLYKLFVDGVDFVGKQENLVEDLITALNTAGDEFDEEKVRTLHPVNGSDRSAKVRLGLSEYTKDKILRTESWVIERFYD